MCGRFVITSPPEALRALFGYWERPNFPPRHNIAPTQPVPVIHESGPAGRGGPRHFTLMRWGLIPAWMKKPPESLLINARAETAVDKPSFRGAVHYRRALIPADGFYEWDRRTKAPHFISLKSGAPFAMAAIWEDWLGADGSEINTTAILTVAAGPDIGAIHPRMPAILPPGAWDTWLDTETVKAPEAVRMLRPLAAGCLSVRRVSTRVNKVANDNPGLLEPAGEADEAAPAQPRLL